MIVHGFRIAPSTSRAANRSPSLREVDAHRLLDQLEGGVQPGRLDQRLPLGGRQRDDHHPAVVLGQEVAAEGAVEVVALLLALAPAELRLGDLAEVADHREGDVGERDA